MEELSNSFTLKTSGKAAHSAYPEEGESAIEKLLDILDDIRSTEFPNDEFFGDTTVNIGTIEGGLALNIIPPKAEAGLAIRLTTKLEPVEEMLRSVVGDRAEIEILSFSEPVRMLEVDGFNQNVQWGNSSLPNDSVTGYTLAGIESNFLKHAYGQGSLTDQLKNNKPAGVTDAQIDLLMNSY